METTSSTSFNHHKFFSSLIKRMSILGGSQGVVILLGFLRNKIIALLLGPKGTGLIDIFNKTAEFISNATNFGFPILSIKRLSELYTTQNKLLIQKEINVIRSWTTLCAILGFLATLFLSSLLSYLSFSSFKYTFHFIALAPVTACLTLFAGEVVIMKSLRMLKHLTLTACINASILLLTTFLCLKIWHFKGIILSLIISSSTALLLQLFITFKRYPWQHSTYSKYFWIRTKKLIQAGLYLNLASIIVLGGDIGIRMFMGKNLNDLGLYAAGITLLMAYARLVFVSMDADFYPRLSTIHTSTTQTNQLVNQQIQANTLLITPFLIGFVATLPLILPLFYNQAYSYATPFIESAFFYIFFKSIATPIAYIALAKHHIKLYLCLESTYTLLLLSLFYPLYTEFHLKGAGLALSFAYFGYALSLIIFYKKKFQFSLTKKTKKILLFQFILLILTYSLNSILIQPSELKYSLFFILLSLTIGYTYLNLKKNFQAL